MLRKLLSAALFFLMTNSGLCTESTPVPEMQSFRSDAITPSNEILEFMADGIKDCRKIVAPKVSRLALCAITMAHYDSCLELFEKKEGYLPEQFRTLTSSAQKFITLMHISGKPHSRVKPEDLQHQVFCSNSFTEEHLRQIALSMVLHHFRLLCQLHYLNEGTKNVGGFCDFSSAENLADRYRFEVAVEEVTKGNPIPNLGSDEQVIDNILLEHTHRLNNTINSYFQLFMGLSAGHFMELVQDRSQFVIPELDFVDDSSSMPLKSKSYAALLTKKISHFKLRVCAEDLDVVAPFTENITWRQDFVKRMLTGGGFSLADGASSVQKLPDINEQNYSLINQARFARAAANQAVQKEIVLLQGLNASLQKAIDVQQEAARQTEAELKEKNAHLKELEARVAEYELLEGERIGKSSKKNRHQKPVQESSPDKELAAKKKEIATLHRKLSKLQDELKEKSKSNEQMQGQVREFMGLFNASLARHKIMSEEAGKLSRELQDMKQKIHEHTALQHAGSIEILNLTGGAGLEVLVEHYFALAKEVEDLKERNEFLSTKEKLLLQARQDLPFTHVSVDEVLNPLLAEMHVLAEERSRLEAEHIVLREENRLLTEIYLKAEKNGAKTSRMGLQMIGLQIDNERLRQEALEVSDQCAGFRLRAHVAEKALEHERPQAAKFYNDNVLLTQQQALLTHQLFMTTQQRDAEYQLRLKMEKEIKEFKEARTEPNAEGSAN